MSNEKEMVTKTCSECGATFQLSKKWANSRPKDYIWRCKECRLKQQKLWYKNMSEEQKKDCHNRMSKSAAKRWKNMTKEEYDKMRDSMSKGDRIYWDTLSEEDYKKRCEAAQNMWNNLTPDQRIQHSSSISLALVNYWKNVSPEEYNRRCKMLRDLSKKYWEDLTDEEMNKIRVDISKRFKKYWNDMTVEDFALWKEKQSKKFNEYLNNLNLTPNKNEAAFIRYLDEAEIKWTYQYRSILIDPIFIIKFPMNTIMNSLHVDPYHKWDFIIELDDRKILVDIDGSIHNPDKTNYTVTYYDGTKFILKDYIEFKDSQREYQTDGYDAYSVACYEDNLTDMNIVTNIKTKKQMSLINFIEYCKEKSSIKRNNTKTDINS